MIEADALRFCDRWLPCWTGNQPASLLACYAPNAFYLDPAVPGGLTGHTQLRPYFEKLLAANPNWAWKAVEVMGTARGFTLKWHVTMLLGGSTVESTGLDIVEVNREDLITRNEVYFDRLPWKKALEARKAADAND